jgi:hypothetical protein
MSYRCDCCGKFRKESEVVLQEEVCSDGFQIDQYFECRLCMSPADEELYFKSREVLNKEKE